MDEWAKDTDNQMGHMPKVVTMLLLSVFPLAGLFLLGVTVYVIWSDAAASAPSVFSVVMDCVICLAPAAFCLYCGYVSIHFALAKYRFEQEGIRVKYPLRHSFVIPWADFQQVCVCRTGIPFGPRGATVICAVRHGEKPNFYGRWKADNPFHYKTIFSINYSEERYQALCEACPVKVEDLRNTLPYRL